MEPYLLAGIVLLVLLAAANLVLLLLRRSGGDELQRLRLMAEQAQAGQRAEAEATRAQLAAAERGLADRVGTLSNTIVRDAGEARALLETKLREMGEHSALRLGDIQRMVNERLRELGEQGAASQRAEAEATRAQLATLERTLTVRVATLSDTMVRDAGEGRLLLETKLREMGEHSALRLAEIQRAVNEKLHDAVEKQMQGSFQRVIDQFGLVQKAMVDVQAVTAQIGDLKRLFTNVKQRGTWGETHLRALLEDLFPQGGWEANRKLREGSDEIVEFAVVMPVRGSGPKPLLALDAKFPAEDYDRLLLAAEAGDVEGERLARRGLEVRLRAEARKIGEKYINPPVTVDFAVMYLPTDGLYIEAVRMPGLIDQLNRDHRVLLMGPTLAPALLRTILLGTLTLSIEQRAHEIQTLLGAVRTEMGKMNTVLDKVANHAGRVSRTIEEARTRTRAMDRKLRSVTLLETVQAAEVLELEAAVEDEE